MNQQGTTQLNGNLNNIFAFVSDRNCLDESVEWETTFNSEEPNHFKVTSNCRQQFSTETTASTTTTSTTTTSTTTTTTTGTNEATAEAATETTATSQGSVGHLACNLFSLECSGVAMKIGINKKLILTFKLNMQLNIIK